LFLLQTCFNAFLPSPLPIPLKTIGFLMISYILLGVVLLFFAIVFNFD